MTTRAPFLSRPYGGYHHREVPSEDAELTHVGPGTPCGEYFRRFWVPVARSDDLKDLPQRIRILGEDLVVFRDGSGNTGLMELHCPHRGTSLEFGLVSEQGLRCCYHGWLIGVDGRILETPGEPADSTLKDRLCHGAYPYAGIRGFGLRLHGPAGQASCFPQVRYLREGGLLFLGWRQLHPPLQLATGQRELHGPGPPPLPAHHR